MSSLLVVQKNLEIGEVLAVDVSSIVAVTSAVNIQIKYNGPARRTMFGVSSFCVSSLFIIILCSQSTLCYLEDFSLVFFWL